MPSAPNRFEVEHLHRLMLKASVEPGVLERNTRHCDLVVARLEKTLSHLATAPHRTLTDSTAGELRANLARMDAILARLRGAARREVLEGAHAFGSILQRMNAIAARAGSVGQSAEIRKLVEERRTQLHRIAQAQLSSALRNPPVLPGGLHALGAPRPGGLAAPRVPARKEQRASKGPGPAQNTATALLGAFREHPKTAGFAAHLAPGGALRALCETAQRGHGLPIGQAAQHYLASRGSSHLWNAVATFHTLVKEGHRPRFSFGSWLKKNVSDHVSHALHGVSQTVSRATDSVAGLAGATRQGISSFSNRAIDMGVRAGGHAGSAVVRGATSIARGGLKAAENAGRSTFGLVRHAGHALAHVAAGGLHAAQGAATWAERKAGGAAHWAGEKVHSGLEWARKTGVVGAVGTGLRKGLSFLKTAAEHTPLGSAVKKGYGFVKAGGLREVWNATKHVAGNAWAGLKTAYNTTSRFLQSPAGQLLVTGLSLAASFIPGGIVVKAVIGAGIGAMQAISEGKDWKSVLASAAGGALTGAIPFLKIGPLAKLGVGALQGGLTAVASGGSLKDALKGAAGGALDAFDPGAFHALKKLKSFTAAEKLLHGKVLANPRARKTLGALEKLGSKGVKGGIWVSGKAARAQHVLDKVVRAGDTIHGVLSEAHELAPGLADALGDNAAGDFVHRLGDWAGQGDHRLQKALEYGHSASDTLEKYRGYLDKGLGHAGVKDPAKAYEKMMARRDRRAGKKGALEHVARLKLEDHAVHDVHEAVHGDPAHEVQNALHWVTALGNQVTAAMKQVERLMHAGRTKEAADRVHALRAMSEQTRAEVDRAVQAAANDPALAKQAASARKHYLEIRAHLSRFVKGLHGLDASPEAAPARDRGHAASSRRGLEHSDPIRELIDGILDGGDGRIHVDRGAARGEVPVHDLQEVDPAAVETWLGSGESVKVFSAVFGAFIPAEGAVVVHHRGRPRGLFERLEGFVDRATRWTRIGMHGLSQVGLVNLFKASKTGDGVEGKLAPDKVALGSTFDEPRRLDVTTLSKMQSFLDGDFAGVRVHTGPGAAEVTRRFNAEAVTVKDHIFFAPGRFNPATVEGQTLIAHELTHVLQKGRANLDVRTAEGEALHSEHSYGHGPQMETLNLRRPEPGFRLASEGEGAGASSGIHTAKRTRSRGHEAGGKDELPDGDEFLEQISGRVYDLLMDELEQAFESR